MLGLLLVVQSPGVGQLNKQECLFIGPSEVLATSGATIFGKLIFFFSLATVTKIPEGVVIGF